MASMMQYVTGSALGLDPLVMMGGWAICCIIMFFVIYLFSKRLESLTTQKSLVVTKIHQILDACLFVLYQKMPHDASLRDMVRDSLAHNDYKKQFDALYALASPHGLPDYHQPFEQLWQSYHGLMRWRIGMYSLLVFGRIACLLALLGLGLSLRVYPR